MGFLRNDEKTFETTSSNIYLNELLGIARENVTEENVMNIPSVSSSVDLILDLISMLNVR